MLRQNINTYIIGKIRDKKVRNDFCNKFELTEIAGALDRIAKANKRKRSSRESGKNRRHSKYEYAFCFIFDDGNKAIGKAMLPPSLERSQLFKTGVNVENK